VDDFIAERIMKGADLLSPAIDFQEALVGMKSQEKVLIKSKSNPNPFAIGTYI
jgi:predicted ribosome-associated RNA-binding protein Tma20